jgi:hypothetical protein
MLGNVSVLKYEYTMAVGTYSIVYLRTMTCERLLSEIISFPNKNQ